MPLSSGDKLGPYEIVAPIGAGGMGEVYGGRDPRLARSVAIKVFKTEFSERFEREAKAIAALNCPHICQIYDVGPDFPVMEYVEGQQLKSPLPVEKALEYARQIAGSLDAAHTKKITHRDFKPANILVTRQGVKLLDFGLAKIEKAVAVDQSTVTNGLTMKGQILGTLLHMSPEQVNGAEADARSDIFSFAAWDLVGPSSQPDTALPPAPEPRLRGWLSPAVAVGLGLGLTTVSAIPFRERLPVAETIRFRAGRLPW